jgi:acyl carrier protein/pimeloyl-ACP methyl ester carboxylesterase
MAASKPIAPASPAPPSLPNVETLAQPMMISGSTKNNNQMIHALNIISEESGIAVSELTDDSVFSDIGVDSLLSMVIASRFREEIGIDLDIDFSLFVDLPTVQDLKNFLQPPQSTHVEVVPVPHHVDQNEIQGTTNSQEIHAAQTIPTEVKTATSVKAKELVATAMKVISEESGIAIAELTNDCVFAEIGVDSLLSMVIASRFREEIGIDLDTDFSLFVDLPTVKDLKDFLSADEPEAQAEVLSETSPKQESSSGVSCGSGLSTPDNVISLSDSSEVSTPDLEKRARPSSYCRPTTSVILQHFPKIAARTLIMFPDGGGSSSSYVSIPRLNIDVAIIGLNSPYARDAWNMKCNYHDLLDSYMTELRRRQPKGPYSLGGWSSGGVMAYMAASRLLQEGEEVDHLIIIDSPIPETVDRLPIGFYEFCETLGLYGNSTGNQTTAPEWLIPHFLATVDVLEDYRPEPLPQGKWKMPKVSTIWASESVLDEKNEPPKELMLSKGSHFLLAKRKDFGPCGWEILIPGADIMTEKVEGGNHFSMMVSLCYTIPSHFLLCCLPIACDNRES